MSLRTQLGASLLVVILSGLSGLAGFGAISQARASDEVNNAFNDFYRKFRASSDQSPAKVKELQSQILDPALKNAAASTPSSAPEGTATEPAAPIMNAAQVPKEIDFPGVPAAAPSPRKSKTSFR